MSVSLLGHCTVLPFIRDKANDIYIYIFFFSHQGSENQTMCSLAKIYRVSSFIFVDFTLIYVRFKDPCTCGCVSDASFHSSDGQVYLLMQYYLRSAFIPPLFWIQGWEHEHVLEDTSRLSSKKFTSICSTWKTVGEWEHFPKCLCTGYHFFFKFLQTRVVCKNNLYLFNNWGISHVSWSFKILILWKFCQ